VPYNGVSIVIKLWRYNQGYDKIGVTRSKIENKKRIIVKSVERVNYKQGFIATIKCR